MKNLKKRGWKSVALWGLVALTGIAFQAVAQDQSPAADADTPPAEQNESADTAADDVLESGAEGSEDTPAETDDEAIDPLAGESGADAFEDMDAKLDRFDPSEKISEDRAVSFPNDI